MLAAIRFSRSLRSTSFITSTRIGFSNCSPLGIIASSSQILHQDPNPISVPPAAGVPASSFFLTHHPLVRLYSRKSFSHKSVKVPNVKVSEDENPKDVGSSCRLRFTKKVCKLSGMQMSVTWTACSAFWFFCHAGGPHAFTPSFTNTSEISTMMLIMSFGAHLAFKKDYPLNIVASGLVNLSLSLMAGTIIATVDGRTLLWSAVLTTVIAPFLFAYGLGGVKNGDDFKYVNIILIISGVVHLPVLLVSPPPGSAHHIIGFVGAGLLWNASLLLRNLLDAYHQNDDDYVTWSTRLYMALMSLSLYCMKFIKWLA